MKKRFTFLSLITILFTNLVSASWFDNFLYDIGGFQTLIFLTMIAVFFAVAYLFLFARLFRNSKGIASVLSFLVALSMAYGVLQAGWDVEGFIYGLGVPSDLLWLIGAFFLFLIILWISYSKEERKFRFYRAFILLGLSMAIISAWTDLVYEKELAITIGMIIVLLALWRRSRVMRRLKGDENIRTTGGEQPRGSGRIQKYLDYRGKRVDQKYDFKLGEQRKAYEQRQHNEEVKARAKRINKIRRRRESNEKQKEREQKQAEKERKRNAPGLIREKKRLMNNLQSLARKNFRKTGHNVIKKGDPYYNRHIKHLERVNQIDSQLKG